MIKEALYDMPEPITEETIEKDYRRMVVAAQEGPEAVQQVMQKISPGQDWIPAAWDLIKRRNQDRPRFTWQDPDTKLLIHFSPKEKVLRRLLNQARTTPER